MRCGWGCIGDSCLHVGTSLGRFETLLLHGTQLLQTLNIDKDFQATLNSRNERMMTDARVFSKHIIRLEKDIAGMQGKVEGVCHGSWDIWAAGRGGKGCGKEEYDGGLVEQSRMRNRAESTATVYGCMHGWRAMPRPHDMEKGAVKDRVGLRLREIKSHSEELCEADHTATAFPVPVFSTVKRHA